MYQVVLIDDEEIIVEGLKRVVNWAAYGCQVVACGHDAASGAAAIRQYHPDLVFTDIKMPNEDGLTMLAGLVGEFPRMQVAVLTGHRDFDYAKQALELGVARYLLKPSKMNELEEALEHMTAVLNQLPPPVPDEPPATASDTANSFLVRQAQGYIREHYTEKLSLQEVASACYVSQWHLSKLLHRHLNQNFYDILNEVRVEQAKLLLEDPALRISEIAALVGYADTAHFSRIFKKQELVSANEYRNLHSGGRVSATRAAAEAQMN